MHRSRTKHSPATSLVLSVTAALLGAVLLGLPARAAEPAANPPPDCPGWPMYGANLARTFSTPCDSPITSSSVSRMSPAWSIDTDRPVTASPVIAQGTVYVGAWDGSMYAVDLASGRTLWTYDTASAPGAAFGPIVSSAAVRRTTVGGQRKSLVVFGSGPVLYALDAADGSLVWQHDFSGGDPDTYLEVESSPAISHDTVYIGMDTHNHPAEDGHTGGVAAVDLATGVLRWKFEPDPGGHGCGGVWGSPLLDTERSQVVFGTANCTNPEHPWSATTEAVIAVDARTGALRWSFAPHEPYNFRDEDFGATPNLYTDKRGTDVIGIGNKDGNYYVLRARDGSPLRRTEVAAPGYVGKNFSVGGFIGSTAVLHGNVYGATALGGPPYYHSIDGTTGDIRWQGASLPSYAASAAVNDVVFNGTLGGILRAYDADTGHVRWAFPLLAPISSAPAIYGRYLVVGSGTSTDLCAKGVPGSQLCQGLLRHTVGSLGSIHAFRLAPASLRPDSGSASHAEPASSPREPAGDSRPPGSNVLVFGAENNRLRAYDPATGRSHVVIPSSTDDPDSGRDVNAQICFDPSHPRSFIAGEDTGQPESPAGWGYFRLTGTEFEELGAVQRGNLVPTYQSSRSNPENYGCGFLSDGRLVTTDVGNQRPGTPGTGQLIVWFPPFDDTDVAYCKVDIDIATAGGIHVDEQDRVYVASARPGLDLTPGGIYRYTDLPTGPTSAEGCGRHDATGAPLATEVHRELFIPADPHVLTPSAIDVTPQGTFYVSSVFNGVIAEYDDGGHFLREVLRPPLPDVLPPYTTGTPFGIGVTPDGTIFYADIGLTLGPPLGPADGQGSVRRIAFRGGKPQRPDTLARGLTYPDGIGLLPKSELRR